MGTGPNTPLKGRGATFNPGNRFRRDTREAVDDGWTPPSKGEVGDQELVAPQRETVRPVEVLDVAVDPLGVPLAVVAQQSEITGALLGNQDVAIGEHEQPPRIDETRHERGRGEARRHL